MTSRRTRIAFTIDLDLLARVERARGRTGESRSALLARALSMLMAQDEQRAKAAQYVRTLRQHPETAADVRTARSTARKSLVYWDDAP